MSFYVDSARVVEPGKLKISYSRMNEARVDYINSYPLGNWTEIMFNKYVEAVSYYDFLKTMVFKNLEVVRKIAVVAHQDFMNTNPSRSELEWLMFNLCIMDPTFEPGRFNLRCTWQCDLLTDICTSSAKYIILTCKNHRRIIKFANVLKSREL